MYGENYTASAPWGQSNGRLKRQLKENKAGNVWKGEVQALWGRSPTCIEAFEGQACGDLPQRSGKQDEDVRRYEKVLC